LLCILCLSTPSFVCKSKGHVADDWAEIDGHHNA